MKELLIENYQPLLSLAQTQQAIGYVKDFFEKHLAASLGLVRVTAPLFLLPSTGLNDELTGKEKRVCFSLDKVAEEVEIVQSLAKWKRHALARYGFALGHGLYADMNAIRKDEELDFLHSAYVDQWDWEKIITKEQRSLDYLKETVRTIYQVLKETEAALHQMYPVLSPVLPEDIYFITTTELEALYPDFDPRQREDAICKQYGAVFLMQIGLPLKDGKPHDERAADYDDWLYNGDLLLYYPVLDQAFELSSMGIRVDEQSLVWQLHVKNETEKLQKPYAQDLLSGKLPYTIGGGIGQSRMCMFFLKKVHIGEVQASVWPEEDRYKLAEKKIPLL